MGSFTDSTKRLSDIPKDHPGYICLTDVTRKTGVSTTKILKMIQRNMVSPIRVNRVRMVYYFFSPEDVAFIQSYKGRVISSF